MHAAPGSQVLSPAHAVVLASGTLAPIASLQQQLFPGLPAARLHHFSCGHVVRMRRPCPPACPGAIACPPLPTCLDDASTLHWHSTPKSGMHPTSPLALVHQPSQDIMPTNGKAMEHIRTN